MALVKFLVFWLQCLSRGNTYLRAAFFKKLVCYASKIFGPQSFGEKAKKGYITRFLLPVYGKERLIIVHVQKY